MAKQSELKQPTSHIEKSDNSFSDFWKDLSDAVMILDGDTFIDVNPAAVHMFGFHQKEELCRKHPGDFSPPHQPGGEVSAILAAENIRQAIVNGKNSFAWIHQRANGDPFSAEVTLSPAIVNRKQVILAIVRDVTEQKRTLDELIESEQRYRDMIEQSNDGIYILDIESRTVVQANRAFAEMLGYTEEEVPGLSVYDIVAAGRDTIDARISRFVQKGEVIVGERLYRKKTGEAFPVWSRYNALSFHHRAALCTRIHDISEQKAREEKLRANEERFRLISENVADCILLSTPTGECLYASPSLAKLGYDPALLMGRNVFEKIFPDDLPHVITEIEAVQNTFAHYSIEFKFQKFDASWLPVEATISLLINDAGVKILMVMRDVTERKRNAVRLQDAHDSLKRQHEEIECTVKRLTQMQTSLVQSEKLASIGQLTAGIAHEINNPLAFVSSNLNRFSEYYHEVRAYLQMWQDFGAPLRMNPAFRKQMTVLFDEEKLHDLEFVDRDFVELMKHTREGAGRIKSIVDQLRGFSHMATDDFSLASINQILDETLTLVWNEIKYKAVVTKEYEELPNILCNAGELKQVFVNLLVNAAHALPEKGGVTLRTKFSGTHVRVEIADTGTGISPEMMKKIFDPFFTTKPVGKGTGLGLWIVSTIMEKHHGTISVESEVGVGTTFILIFPVDHQETELAL